VKSLPSTEFRKSYAALEEPCEVTVMGRLIGTWFPVGSIDYAHSLERPAPLDPIYQTQFNSRPFTPVPKKGKKG
jgi:hypothetical protein